MGGSQQQGELAEVLPSVEYGHLGAILAEDVHAARQDDEQAGRRSPDVEDATAAGPHEVERVADDAEQGFLVATLEARYPAQRLDEAMRVIGFGTRLGRRLFFDHLGRECR